MTDREALTRGSARDELVPGPGPKRGKCCRCGARRTRTLVMVRATGLDRFGSLSASGKAIGSKSRSFCRPCGETVYATLEAVLLNEDNR